MQPLQVVVDTNVVVAALRSRRGASHRLLRLLGNGRFDLNLSVPLVLEYEDAASRLVVTYNTKDFQGATRSGIQ